VVIYQEKKGPGRSALTLKTKSRRAPYKGGQKEKNPRKGSSAHRREGEIASLSRKDHIARPRARGG